jgi:signal transduction histidine kinase
MQDLLGEELFRLNEPFIQAALAGKVQEFERAATNANGEKRVIFAHYIPHLQGDKVQGFFVLILDITERKQLEAALVSIAEERQRALGQELHDNLGQQIAAISYQAKALEKKILASGNIEAEQFAASIAMQAQNAVIQCKQLAQGLLPFELEANGLIGALRALASRIAITYEVRCDFVCKDEVNIEDVELALNLYRIAQEATNNAIRHGGAKHLIILLTLANESLTLSICDDGCGFTGADTKLAPSGMGVKIMKYRANQYGASLKFLLRAEGGTEVRVEMRVT